VVGTLRWICAVTNDEGTAGVTKDVAELLLHAAVDVGLDGGRYALSLVRVCLHQEKGIADVAQRPPGSGVREALWRKLHPLAALGPGRDETLDAGLDELVVGEQPVEHHDCSPAVAVPIIVVPDAWAVLGVVMLHEEVVARLLVSLVASGFVQPQGVKGHVIVIVAGTVEAASVWN
jgi:hypothetical protein